MEQPVGRCGQFVIVVRVARAQKTEDVLIKEVEVPESMDVAQHGMVAEWVSLVGIGESGQNVPRRGDGQKQQQAREGLQIPPASPLAAHQQQRNGRGGKEDGRDEPLGEHGQRQRRPHSIKAEGPARFEAR